MSGECAGGAARGTGASLFRDRRVPAPSLRECRLRDPGRRFSTLTPWGRYEFTEAFIDHLSRGERKLAVTITSSMGSLTGNTSGGSIAYRSSKAAVHMVMRSAAIDFAPRGVACVLINPGWVKTDMGGPGASLTPEESVTASKRLIETLGSAESVKFFDYDGREHAW